MNEPATRVALRAQLVFPITSPPLRDGIVTIDRDRIVAVSRGQPNCPLRDLGNVAILPGLVNPHTHLELSLFSSPLGQPGMPFSTWIRDLVARRRDETSALDQSPTQRHMEPLLAGLRQSLSGGVTTVGDIASWDSWELPNSLSTARHYVFRELIGWTDDQLARQVATARRHVATRGYSGESRLMGLSPHAPYTTTPRLVREIVQLSRQSGVPVAMHLAESEDELRLLRSGDGPMRDTLQQLNAWVESAFPGDMKPLDYLHLLSRAGRSLVIHGNYLTPSDWQFLAQHRDSMTTIYCPRTHHYFRHRKYPLSQMLRAGTRVAIGTDSRASNPDLSLFEELRFAAVRHGDVQPDRILRMGTRDAAKALGCADRVGSLQPGRQADLVIIELGTSGSASHDPHAALFDHASAMRATMCRGEVAWGAL